MDHTHLQRLQKIMPKGKVRSRIVEMINYCQVDSKRIALGIPDPYYGESKDFELVLDLLEVGIKYFFDKEVIPSCLK